MYFRVVRQLTIPTFGLLNNSTGILESNVSERPPCSVYVQSTNIPGAALLNDHLFGILVLTVRAFAGPMSVYDPPFRLPYTLVRAFTGPSLINTAPPLSTYLQYDSRFHR